MGSVDPGDDRAARSDVDAMRAALTHTWYPFFARFPRPTPVQLAAFRPLVAGRDAVLCSPTASGKTEAVVAPLVERALFGPGAGPGTREQAKRPALLVVSPTRALVNDLLRRVQEPLGRLGLRVHRRTGDHATLDRERPPHVLVTTPESLDSLLVRHPGFLRDVQAVALDELHILDNTSRGDQLRVLLERLRAVSAAGARRVGGAESPARLQTAVTSATIHAPEELAARYLDPTQADVVSVPGQREIECVLVPTRNPAAILLALLAIWGQDAGKAKKILVFLPSRADVEDLAARARAVERLAERAHAHHGSLSRGERERVEARFLSDPSAICFATMTLELGIDVGDVDLVALVGPPPSVPSFLQRIGRGNRRTGTTRVLACCRDAADEARFRHLEACARTGDLCPSPYVFRPGVLVQQAGSLLLQSRDRWLSAPALHRRLPAALRDRWSEERLERLLRELTRSGWLAPGRASIGAPNEAARFVAGPQLEQGFERATIHSNLAPEAATVEVVDDVTGRSLGHVLAGERVSPELPLAGRGRRALREQEGRLYVRDLRAGREATGAAVFAPRGPQSLSRELARSLHASLGLPPDALPFADVRGAAVLYHFQGSLAAALLARHLKRAHGWSVSAATPLALVLKEAPFGLQAAGRPPAVSAEALDDTLPAVALRLARLAGAGPFHKLLPEEVQLAFVRAAVPVAAIARTWSEGRLWPVPREQEALWEDLVGVR
jgi:ATP-dependent Lhr-like helicase